MAKFTKRRPETLKVGVKFDDALRSGDSVSSILDVKVLQYAGDGVWSDVTVQFGTLGETLNGNQVDFTINEAPSSDDQDTGEYVVFTRVETVDGEKLARTTSLQIIPREDV